MTETVPPQFAFKYGFPIKENCDPTNPYEAFLWMLVAMPNMEGGQLVMPIAYLQLVSKRLWDTGARPVADPVIKYRKPAAMGSHWLTSPGAWVGVDEPDDDPRTPARRSADAMLPIQKAEIFNELAKDMTPKQRYEYGRALMAEQDGDEL